MKQRAHKSVGKSVNSSMLVTNAVSNGRAISTKQSDKVIKVRLKTVSEHEVFALQAALLSTYIHQEEIETDNALYTLQKLLEKHT